MKRYKIGIAEHCIMIRKALENKINIYANLIRAAHNSNLLSDLINAQKEAEMAARKVRDLYEEYAEITN